MTTSLNRYAISVAAALLSGIAVIFFFTPILDVSFLVILLVIALLAFCYYQLFFMASSLASFNKRKKHITIGFTLVFSFLAFLSLKGEQFYLSDNSWLTRAYVYIGTYATICSLVLWIILSLVNIKMNEVPRSVSKWNILKYALPSLVVWTLYLLAIFPGGMTADSIYQWEQAHTGKFNDWHPLMYTFFIMILTKIWDSPAVIGLSQIIIISLIFGYCMRQFEKAGVKPFLLWIISIIFALSPINGIYSITIWKDVLYSTFILLFTTLVFNLVITNGKWIKRNTHFFLFIMTALGVIFFRHNGFAVCLVMLVILLICFRETWKQWVFSIFFIVAAHYIVTGPVFTYLKVVSADPNEALSIPTQQLARVVAYNGNLTDEQADYLNQILPLELWKKNYNPYLTDPIKFAKQYNRSAIFPDHLSDYLRTWWDICMQNPKLVIQAALKQTSLVWQMNQPNDGYTSTFVTNVFYGNKFGLKNEIIFSPLTLAVKKYLSISDTTFKPLIWRPAIYTFFILLFTFVAFLRNNWKAWLVPLIVLLNTGTVLAALPAQDFRYLYSNSLVFFIAFLFAFVSYKKKEMRT
ncbi:DUF6020 family protein [Anoxybacteroides rupiense]|uniref:DUF6020 family protein n=1 Tax=Anoxybacteroides rupiense TaxID=311460 RepID=A0ABD5IR52_9BACL|nr:DUF6020 family protein [Anoxybacillus rupiensis]MBB3907746.1 hypothetical protein [Anoxybacillus rupiensis]MED5050742.1 DUF6020 family protein [Anoxybacillus rupiensis]